MASVQVVMKDEPTTAAEIRARYAGVRARRRALAAPAEQPKPEPKAAPVSQLVPAVVLKEPPLLPATIFLMADEWFPFNTREPSPPTTSKIINIVSWHFHVGRLELISPSRRSRFTFPRQIAMYLIRNYTTRSFTEIGNMFGGRDHSTVIHAVDKIGRLRTDDQDLRIALAAIEKELAA